MNTQSRNTKKNKLIQLLNSFEDTELKRFHQFLSSPYFNVDTRTTTLLSTLQKHGLDKIVWDNAIKSKIYQVVFSDIDPVKGEINQVQKNKLAGRMSRLLKLAKEFLTVEKQYDLFETINTKTNKELTTQNIKKTEDYAHAFQINKNRLKYITIKNLFSKEDNYSDLIYQLDVHYLLQKLQLSSVIMSVKNPSNKQYDVASFQAIKALLNIPKYKNHPLIILHLTIIDLVENGQEATYYQLRKLLVQYKQDISKIELTGFYTVASNFCSQQIRLGKLVYINKALELYKFIEENDLLLEGNTLQIHKLVNIVNLSCQAKDFKWATKLVNKYYKFINKGEQKSAYHLNLGAIAFYQGKYKEAIKHLIRIDKSGEVYDLHYRILLLKSYYQIDQQYDERTMTSFRSSKSFIKKNKTIPPARKESNKNFVEVLINLYRLRHQQGKMTIEKIYNKIQKKAVLGNKKWLLEKLEELKK